MRGDIAISNECIGLPLELGFVSEPVGTHSSRTIMLRELADLLAATHSGDSYEDLRDAATTRNAVRKSSAAGRSKTFRHLREFYALDRTLPVYAGLRRLWDTHEGERPLLAMLCASARDPVLRASGEHILGLSCGSGVSKSEAEAFLAEAFPNRYSETVLPRTVRNLLSSWTQSGHLCGHAAKKRAKAVAGPAAASYALFLGYLCGKRGEGLFDTPWTRILDSTIATVHAHAEKAHTMGLITLKRAGGIVDVDFSPILTAEGRL